PVADAGGAQSMPEDGTLILDGAASSDANDDAKNPAVPLIYQWTVPQAFIDAGGQTGPTDQAQLNITVAPNVTADEQYNFVLTVTDSDGGTDDDVAVVTVEFVNQPPVADAG